MKQAPRFIWVFLFAAIAPLFVFAQTTTLDANALTPQAAITVSPASQSVIAGSTFDVSIVLNTEGRSVNTLDLTIQFPPDKLQVVNPSVGATSLIQLWLQPPTYSNTNGNLRLTGVIPNGIVTGGGVVTTIEFKAIGTGPAAVTLTPDSSILANDGLGTSIRVDTDRGVYTITPQPPAGPIVFSTTHPIPSQWYNDPNLSIGWQQAPGMNEFAYILDDAPYTNPGAGASTTANTSVSFSDMRDGRWYFHVKALSNGVWGATTHFPVQIDTTPPAAFSPAADILPGDKANKILVSFFTTDALSGIDHYEVAVVDRSDAASVGAPVFTQAQSPYEFAAPSSGSYRVFVRAFDRAGNVRDASLDVVISLPFIQYLKDHSTEIVIGLLLFIIFLFLLHYFFGHKLLRRAQRIMVAIEEENRREDLQEAQETVKEDEGLPGPS